MQIQPLNNNVPFSQQRERINANFEVLRTNVEKALAAVPALPIPLNQGGTGAGTAFEALTNLSGMPFSQMDRANINLNNDRPIGYNYIFNSLGNLLVAGGPAELSQTDYSNGILLFGYNSVGPGSFPRFYTQTITVIGSNAPNEIKTYRRVRIESTFRPWQNISPSDTDLSNMATKQFVTDSIHEAIFDSWEAEY